MRPTDSILDWVVIGGGIHGTYFSNAMIRSRMIHRSDIRVIDPHSKPLEEWKRVTRNVGMDYLRSPKVHHIDLEPFSLKHFAQCEECSGESFIAPHDRPSLDLFNRHADSVIERNGLTNIRIRDVAVHIEIEPGYAIIHTEGDTIRSKRVLLSVGAGNKPCWPEWALQAQSEDGNVQHVLGRDFDKKKLPETGHIVVVGGGMSAVQAALSLMDQDRDVTLLTPHPVRVNNYDSDPGWMGPKYLQRFRSERCHKKRRVLITHARNRGSVTHDLSRKLNSAVKSGRCSLVISRVKNCSVLTSDLMLMKLINGEQIASNATVLATGYDKNSPGGNMIGSLAGRYGLKCAACGYPITDEHLEWTQRIYLSGALAELEVGPAARNVIGARMSFEKIRVKI